MELEVEPSIRKPIIDSETANQFPDEKLEQEWQLLTEAARRNVLVNSKIREVLIPFCTTAVSELLPHQFISVLSSEDEGVEKLWQRYSDCLGRYLALDALPDNQLKPDLRYARGITEEEREMVKRRYRFARDVKILALGAELLEQDELVSDEPGRILLASGVEIIFDGKKQKVIKELLYPGNWVKRSQLKDRVYVVKLNEDRCILKERKTPRHYDTWKGGHIDGLSSLEEFHLAKYLSQHGVLERDGIKIGWEKPLVCVTFPDGFQFVVFDFEENLLDGKSAVDSLTRKIKENRSEFEEEFRQISHTAQKFINYPRIWTQEGVILNEDQNLSFGEFARIKACRMTRRAAFLFREVIITHGFVDFTTTSLAPYAFQIPQKGKLILRILGFDLEYLRKEFDQSPEERLERLHQYERDWESTVGLMYLNRKDNQIATIIEQAAYLAFLEREGILLPKM